MMTKQSINRKFSQRRIRSTVLSLFEGPYAKILNPSKLDPPCRYLDPEYFLRRQLTTASDVYAYGVCLMELVTGQQSIDHMRFEEFNLIEWVNRFMIP